jgi:hypothetical protein
MTDRAQEDMDRTQQARESDDDELLAEQEHKGYGEDKAEREGALADE